jgi:hypothetical protein
MTFSAGDEMPGFSDLHRSLLSLCLSILLLLPPGFSTGEAEAMPASLAPDFRSQIDLSQPWIIIIPDFFDSLDYWRQAQIQFIASGISPANIIDLSRETGYVPGQRLEAQADLLAQAISRESGLRPGIKPHLIAKGSGGLVARWYLQCYQNLMGIPAPVEDVMAINVPHQGRKWAKWLAWLCPYVSCLRPYVQVLEDLEPDSVFMHRLRTGEEQDREEVKAGQELLKTSFSALDKGEGETFQRALQQKLGNIDQTQRQLGRRLSSLLHFSKAVVLEEADQKRMARMNQSLRMLLPLERLLDQDPEHVDPQALENAIIRVKIPIAQHLQVSPLPVLSTQKLETALSEPLQKIDGLIKQLRVWEPPHHTGAWQQALTRALDDKQGLDARPLLAEAEQVMASARLRLNMGSPLSVGAQHAAPLQEEINELRGQAETLDAGKAYLMAQVQTNAFRHQAKAFSQSQAVYGVIVLERMCRKWTLRQGMLQALEQMEDQRLAWIQAGEELLAKKYEGKSFFQDLGIFQQHYQGYLSSRARFQQCEAMPDAGIRDEELDYYLERLLPAENDVTAAAGQGLEAFGQALSSLTAGQANRERLHFYQVALRKQHERLVQLEKELRPLQPRPAASSKFSPANLGLLRAGPSAEAWQAWLGQEAAYQAKLIKTWQKLQDAPQYYQAFQKVLHLEHALDRAETCWKEKPAVEAELVHLERQLVQNNSGTSDSQASTAAWLQLAHLRAENYLACDWNDLIGKMGACTDRIKDSEDLHLRHYYALAQALAHRREALLFALKHLTEGYAMISSMQARKELLIERLAETQKYLVAKQVEQRLTLAKVAWARYQAARQRLTQLTQARQMETLLQDQKQVYVRRLLDLAREAQAAPQVKSAIDQLTVIARLQDVAPQYDELLHAAQLDAEQLYQEFEYALAAAHTGCAQAGLSGLIPDILKIEDSGQAFFLSFSRDLQVASEELCERLGKMANHLHVNTGIKHKNRDTQWVEGFVNDPVGAQHAVPLLHADIDRQSETVQTAVLDSLMASELKTRAEEVWAAAASVALKERWDRQDTVLLHKSVQTTSGFDPLAAAETDVIQAFDNTGGPVKRAMESADFNVHWQKVQEARKLVQAVAEALSADPAARLRGRDELQATACELAGRKLESYLAGRANGVGKDLVKQIDPLVHEVVLGGQHLDTWARDRIKNQLQQRAEAEISRQGNATVKQAWKLLKGLQQGEDIGQSWKQNQIMAIKERIQNCIQAKNEQIDFFQRKKIQQKSQDGLMKVQTLSEGALGLLERQNTKMADAVEAWLPYPQEQRVWRNAADLLQIRAQQQMLATVSLQREQLDKIRQGLTTRLTSQALEIKQLDMAILAETMAKKYADLGKYLNSQSSDILKQAMSLSGIMQDNELLMNMRQGVFQEVIRANPALCEIERLQDIRAEFKQLVGAGGQEAEDWFRQTQLAKHLERLNGIREDFKLSVDQAIDQGSSKVIQGRLGDLLKRWGVESQYLQTAMDLASGPLKQYLRDSPLYAMVDRYTNVPALVEEQFGSLLGSMQSYFAASSLAKTMDSLAGSATDLWDQIAGRKPLNLTTWSQNLGEHFTVIEGQVKEISLSVSRLLETISNADSSIAIWKNVEEGLKQFSESLGQSVTAYVRLTSGQGLGVDFLNMHVGFGSLGDLLKFGNPGDLFKLGNFGDMLGTLFHGYELNLNPKDVWNQITTLIQNVDWKSNYYEDLSGYMRSLSDSTGDMLNNGLQWIGDRWKAVGGACDIVAGGPERWLQEISQQDWKKGWAALDQFIPEKYKPLKSALDEFILKEPNQWDYMAAIKHLSVYLNKDWQQGIHTAGTLYKVYQGWQQSDKANYDYRNGIMSALDALSEYLNEDWKAKYREYKKYEGYANEGYKMYQYFQQRDWGSLISEGMKYGMSMIPLGQDQVYVYGQGLANKIAAINGVPIDVQGMQAEIDAALGTMAAKGVDLDNLASSGESGSENVADYLSQGRSGNGYQYTASMGQRAATDKGGVVDFNRQTFLQETGETASNTISTGSGVGSDPNELPPSELISGSQRQKNSKRNDADKKSDQNSYTKPSFWNRVGGALKEGAETWIDPRKLQSKANKLNTALIKTKMGRETKARAEKSKEYFKHKGLEYSYDSSKESKKSTDFVNKDNLDLRTVGGELIGIANGLYDPRQLKGVFQNANRALDNYSERIYQTGILDGTKYGAGPGSSVGFYATKYVHGKIGIHMFTTIEIEDGKIKLGEEKYTGVEFQIANFSFTCKIENDEWTCGGGLVKEPLKLTEDSFSFGMEIFNPMMMAGGEGKVNINVKKYLENRIVKNKAKVSRQINGRKED